MVKIRLSRQGKRNDPFYRIVATDSAKKRSGKMLEILGYWHPRVDSKEINKKAIEAWVAKGAQVSPAVKKLMS
ncbi:30S ribosomal protein S16 [Candidatus Microgenomates bacterium]|nr:MAG: 30S ribosomal protein S16 [Candidatus Microgenomates bacterium]